MLFKNALIFTENGTFEKGSFRVENNKFTLGSENVEIKAIFEVIPIYTVTVTTDGNGAASAAPASGNMGAEVSLTATANAGYVFKEWQVVSGNVTIVNNTFALGTENVEVKAIFELIPVSPEPPKTGDDSSLGLWLCLLGMAGVGMLMLKKRTQN